jgi:transposase-like protein
MTLALMGNTMLRTAITRNLVSFPAQIRSFMKRSSGDVQERIVQLYFVRGWSVRSICERYGLSKAMAHKLLAEWRIRAVESGYIQEIEPGNLAGLVNALSAPAVSAGQTQAVAMQTALPVHVPAMVASELPRLREFNHANAMRINAVRANTTRANGVPAASIPTVESPALSAGSGA